MLNTDNPELLIYETEKLNITILGGIKITGLDRMRVTLKIELKQYSSSLPIRHKLRLVPHQTSRAADRKDGGTSEQLHYRSRANDQRTHYQTGAIPTRKLEHLKPKKKKSDNSLSRKESRNTVSKRPKTDDQHPC
ncbi:MAG: hypothetical protein IPO37_25595 [Saprospiraceae bacterium]|nr:hypothetical protein [Saprospiraceae bacterium]